MDGGAGQQVGIMRNIIAGVSHQIYRQWCFFKAHDDRVGDFGHLRADHNLSRYAASE